jgi:hypothetical protein
MSGPITAGYFFVHGVLALSAAAVREARAIRGEMEDVRERREAREGELARARQDRQAARADRLAALRAAAGRQEARRARLASLVQTLGATDPAFAARIPAGTTAPPPAPPGAGSAGDDAAWAAHVDALDAAVGELQALLAGAGGRYGERVRAAAIADASAPAPGIDDVLSAYVLQREMQGGLDPADTERLRATAARVLSRLELAEGEALPAGLEALARAIVLAPSVERAESLAVELRHAVQREREALAAERARTEQEAAALVLEQSLADLGYEVEGIEATLFADGGTAHFRRAGWENYFVRLRVDPREATVNFNVVRARGDEESAERRRLDALAEDRWCAEFPRLLQTLAARGLRLDVTRRLEAGEVPVQVVDGRNLPAIAADDAVGRAPAAPRARPVR